MRLTHLILAATALVAPLTATMAAVTGSMGGGTTAFLSLSPTGLEGGSVALLTGGTVYTNDMPFADIPKGGVFEDKFLAAGPSSGNLATLTFTTPVDYLSFLWGSPDMYNVLTVTSSTGIFTFDAAGLGFPVTNGDQSFSQYVQFQADVGELITSVSFSNAPVIDAFEAANFSIGGAVPEPASWAMMIAGFGLVGASMRRRSAYRMVQAV